MQGFMSLLIIRLAWLRISCNMKFLYVLYSLKILIGGISTQQ